MYSLLVTTLPLVLITLLTFIFHKKNISVFNDGKINYDTAKWFYSTMTILSLFVIIIINLAQISEQKKRFTVVDMLENKKEIYVERADSLLVDFKEILLISYPQYEKEIFGDMTPKDLQMLFVKYPDVKNALVQMNYTDKLQVLKDDIYNKEIEIETIKREIQFRYIDPWIFGSWLPIYKTN